MPFDVQAPEMVLVIVTSGLTPATTYSVMLSASTSGGVGTGSLVELTTDEYGKVCLFVSSMWHVYSLHNSQVLTKHYT